MKEKKMGKGGEEITLRLKDKSRTNANKSLELIKQNALDSV